MDYKDIANKEHLINFKNELLGNFDQVLSSLIESPQKSDYKKAALLCYWLRDFNLYLDREKTFDPKRLKRYERGDIIKANFGFNVGDEHGGMHYAVVLDNDNYVNSGIITVVPLISKKDGKEVYKRDVDLGNEIYEKVSNKCKELSSSILSRISKLESLQEELKDSSDLQEKAKEIREEIKKAKKELDLLRRTEKELGQMKLGSIALIEQITAISKLRIFDPRKQHHVLSGIKLSSEGLDLIDEKLQFLFLKKTAVSYE